MRIYSRQDAYPWSTWNSDHAGLHLQVLAKSREDAGDMMTDADENADLQRALAASTAEFDMGLDEDELLQAAVAQSLMQR